MKKQDPSGLELQTSPEILSRFIDMHLNQILEEVNFFLSQGLTKEAFMLLEDLLKQYPECKLTIERASDVKWTNTNKFSLQGFVSEEEPPELPD